MYVLVMVMYMENSRQIDNLFSFTLHPCTQNRFSYVSSMHETRRRTYYYLPGNEKCTHNHIRFILILRIGTILLLELCIRFCLFQFVLGKCVKLHDIDR